MPDPKFLKKRTHRGIQLKYNRFADLGNVKPIYRKTFNKLSGLRTRARYLKGDIPISFSKKEAHRLLGIVKNMVEDAAYNINIH